MDDLQSRLTDIENITQETTFKRMFCESSDSSDTTLTETDINNMVNQLGENLIYIKSGSSGHTFKGTIKYKGRTKNYGVKIVGYPKKLYGEPIDIKRPENAELKMINILSEFVLSNKTSHIVLPIASFRTSIKPFIELHTKNIIRNKKYDEFIERYKQNKYYDEASILISEWANSNDLLAFIRKNYKKMNVLIWKVFFFQILSVLATIQSKYPNFRHNDLKANNILVQKIRTRHKKNNFVYYINGNLYVIPNIGFQLKLWDFDFATIPGIVDNSKVEHEWTNKINVRPKRNQYYDIHFFFITLIQKNFFPQFRTSTYIPNEIKRFVARVLPHDFRHGNNVSKRSKRIMINDEYCTPLQLIEKDILFSNFKVAKDNPLYNIILNNKKK